MTMPVRTHLLFGTQHRTFSLLRYLKARPWLSLLSVVALLLLVSFYALYVGNEADGVVGVLLALVGQGDEFLSFLLFELRVPRILAAVIAGAGLGAGGCLLQTMARNRLATPNRSEEHTSELQSRGHLVCRLLLEKKK